MERFVRHLRVAVLVAGLVLAASLARGQTTGYYPGQGWGPDDHEYLLAYRDNGFDGAAFQSDGGSTVTVCTQLSIRAKESGSGSSTIDVVLYQWNGSDWIEYVKATITIDGGSYAWFHSSTLADTLPEGYYRQGCCNETGNPVTIQCTTDPVAESSAYVKPSTSSCPNPWGVSSENLCFDDLNMYMTYTEETVVSGLSGRRVRMVKGGTDR